MPKKVNKKTSECAVATLSDDCVDDRHYIINNHPECISFWSLTSKLHLMKESELIDLIRLNIDFTTKVKCNGVCTIKVKVSANYHHGKEVTSSYRRKSPCCDGKCLVHIKRIL